MSKAIRIIQTEHAGLVAILRTLEALLDDIEEGKARPEFALFRAMVEYLTTFIYRFHHPKETDHLFPAIARRDKHAQELIERLEAQHRQGAMLLKELAQALARYEQEGDSAQALFRDAFDRYHDFEWRHMNMEEKDILPLAQRVLSAADWAAMEQVFTDHDDPLFGANQRQQFVELFHYITRHTPVPYGLDDT